MQRPNTFGRLVVVAAYPAPNREVGVRFPQRLLVTASQESVSKLSTRSAHNRAQAPAGTRDSLSAWKLM